MNKVLRGLLLSAIPVCLSQPVAAETEFNVVGTWSSVHLHKNFEAPFWGKILPEASGGEMVVQITPFDQMGLNGKDIFTYLKNGVFDVGMTISDYVGGEAPALEGLDMPMITTTAAKAYEVSLAYMPIAEKVMQSKYDAHVLAIAPNTAQIVYCNTPITGLDDLKGKKIRASGRTASEFLSALGAQPTSIGFNEVPGALEQGVIECAVTSSVGGYNAGWQDVTTHLLTLPVAGWDTAITAISNKKWNSLTEEQRELIESEITANFMEPVWSRLAEDDAKSVACLIGDGECAFGEPGNMTLIAATEGDMKRAREALTEIVLPSWASRIDAETAEMWNEHIAPLVDLPINTAD